MEQCGLEYEWIGMQQKGRMQAALRVTTVRNCAGATEHAKAVMPAPRNTIMMPLPSASLQTTKNLPQTAANSVQTALNAALARLEKLKASLASLEEKALLRSNVVDQDQEDAERQLCAALAQQCESLTLATAALRHRQQQQLAHSIIASTPSTTTVPSSAGAAVERCAEGDAMVANGDFAAAAVHYGRSAAGASSAAARAVFKQLQREALLKAKAQKKAKKKQSGSQTKSNAQPVAVISAPRPRRCLPESLATGNCRFDVRVTAAMAQALAQELLEIPGLEQTAGTGDKQAWCEDAVRTSLESYEITEEMKRMQLRSVS